MFLEISQNSQENTCVRVSFLIKLKAPATLLKNRFWHRFFPVNFAKFLRTPFSQNTSGRRLLKLCNIYGKLPVLGSLFSKVVGLLGCSYIKKGLQHRCFLPNLQKDLRIPFLKNICERLLL